MRVLALCEGPPTLDPVLSDGATLIAANVLPLLSAEIELEVAYFRDRPADPAPAVAHRAIRVTQLPIRGRRAGIAASPVTLLPRATWQRRLPVAVQAVAELARDADLVYVHGLHASPYAFDVRHPVVVQEIDPWSLYWRRRAALGPRRRRLYDREQARRARRLERRLARRVSAHLVVNEDDARALESVTGGRVTAVPNGIDLTAWTRVASSPRAGNVIGFVGSLDYPPNVAVATTLAREVLPRVRAQVPDASLLLAGRSPTSSLRELGGLPGVEVMADVEDLATACQRISVAAYLDSPGLGTKNTVQEVLAAGCALVASSSALRGIGAGPHVTIAETPEVMADEVVRLLRDPTARLAQVDAAGRFVATLPTWQDSADRYEAIFMAAMSSAVSGRH